MNGGNLHHTYCTRVRGAIVALGRQKDIPVGGNETCGNILLIMVITTTDKVPVRFTGDVRTNAAKPTE